jgi:hypothetical protein
LLAARSNGKIHGIKRLKIMFYTYAHYKPDNSVFYIGKGQRRRAWSKEYHNNHWNNIVAKYPDYKVEILARWSTEKEAFDHEVFLIDTFRAMGIKLTNVTNGGTGVTGYKHTPESIKKRLDAMEGYAPSEETKEKMREAHLGEKNHFFGKKHLDVVKQKISETKKANPSKPWLGKSRSEETRKKISDALKGRVGYKHTDESKEKLSLAHKGKKQAPPSEETRKKLSESGKMAWIERRKKVRKEV